MKPADHRAQFWMGALRGACCFAAAFGATMTYAADQYPARTITLIVPNAAGSASDILARTLAEELKNSLKQNISIVNREGANGAIAINAFKRDARPDGYTLLFASMTQAVVNPNLQQDAKYDTASDFEPIARHVLQPLLWVENKPGKFNSLKDAIDFARANPDMLRVSRSGYGASTHLVSAALMTKTGIKLSIIGFNGPTQSYVALKRGDTELMVDLPQPMLPRIKGGEVLPLAVTSAKRIKALPDVPSWTEQGMDTELVAWYVYLAPKGTPKEIVDMLNVEINKVLLTPKIRQPLEEVGGIVEIANPADIRTYIRSENVRWGQIVKAANLKSE